MLRALFCTGRTTVQGLSFKWPLTSRLRIQIIRQNSDSHLVLNSEQSLTEKTDKKDTEENYRIFNRNAIFDLCLEKFDIDLLYFHESLTKDEWCALVDRGFMVEETMNLINYEEILKTNKINNDDREKLSKLKLFGMRIPKKYGGLEYKETEAQYIHEILAIRPSLARMVAEQEEMGVKILVKYGTEAQKAKYLPKLVTGEMTIAFAFLEESSSSLNPHSYLGLEVLQEGDKFLLKGEKSWVYNANMADVFIVIGTQTVLDDEGLLKITSLFIVDKDKENMIIYKPMEKKWFRGVNICHVLFNEVKVGPDSVLGQYGKGFDMFLDIFRNNKTSVLAECTSVMKRLLFDATDKCDHLKVYGKYLNFDYGDYGVGELAVSTFAVESLTYYLASRADFFENPVLAPEIALAKIFATEVMPEAIQTYFNFIGRFSYSKNSVLEEFVQNSPYYSMLDDSIFDMKIYIMSQAIKYLSVMKRRKFKELSDPFTFPLTKIKYLVTEVGKNEEDTAKPKLDLRDVVSYETRHMADELEYCVSRLAYCSEKHILTHMKHSMEHDYNLLILCEMLANIYALIACIARASKASSLQTQNYNVELHLTNIFALKTSAKVKNLSSLFTRNVEELESTAEIGRKALTNKNYIAEHPLTRAF